MPPPSLSSSCRPLLLASAPQRDLDQCKALLRTPLLLHSHTGSDGRTPLHLACAVPDGAPTVSLLLDMGADVTAKDR